MTAHRLAGRSGRGAGRLPGAARGDVRAARQRPVGGDPGAVPVDPAVGEPAAPGQPVGGPAAGAADRHADRRPRRRAGRPSARLWAAARRRRRAGARGRRGRGRHRQERAGRTRSWRSPGGPARWCARWRASRRNARSTCSRCWRRCGGRAADRPAEIRELAGDAGWARSTELVPELAEPADGRRRRPTSGRPGAGAPAQPRRAGRVLRPAQRPAAGAARGRGRPARRPVHDRGAAPAGRPLGGQPGHGRRHRAQLGGRRRSPRRCGTSPCASSWVR